jgi:hypothetical protein
MRSRWMIAAAVLAATALALPVAAQQSGEAWKRNGAGWDSGTVKHLRTDEREAGGAVDAVLHGRTLFVTSWRTFSVYDVSDPLDPRHLWSRDPAPSLYNEQPQANGKILLVSRDARYAPNAGPFTDGPGGGVLEIWDVRDRERPSQVGVYTSTQRDHLWACVLDCSYAYSASGTILDLADPTSPKVVGNWATHAPYRPLRFHHIAEVAPGIVLTGSLPMHVLDARTNPASPTPLASVEPETTVPNAGVMMAESLPGRVAWPSALNGRVAMTTMETPFSGPCDEESGDFQTFLTPGWRDSGTFRPADSYDLRENGVYVDGRPPANALGCSAYGLDVHPRFSQNGGAVALTFFEHGVRVLDIDAQGRISERGGFLPLAGNAARPIWVTDDILYAIDLHRGIDILRVGKAR